MLETQRIAHVAARVRIQARRLNASHPRPFQSRAQKSNKIGPSLQVYSMFLCDGQNRYAVLPQSLENLRWDRILGKRQAV